MHRHADAVEIAIRSNLIDSFGSGIILTGPGWLYVAPTYQAQRLYARAAGSYPVRIEPSVSSPGASLPWPLEEPDLSAALSPDGRMLRLYGVNSTGKNLEVQTTLAGYGQGVRDTQMHILQDAQGALTPEIMNSRDEPERVRVFTRPVNATGQQFALSFAPFSLTLYEFTLDGIAVR